MNKTEAQLRIRLHAAHMFIGALKATAKDYGSAFSSEVHYDCDKFLKSNKPINEPRAMLVEKKRYLKNNRATLRAKIALKYIQHQAMRSNQLTGIEDETYFAWILEKANEALKYF